MRILLDTLIAMTLIGILGGLVWQNREHAEFLAQRDATREEVRRFQQQIHLQVALARVAQSDCTFPDTIDSGWFNGNIPRNTLLGVEHPWVEVIQVDPDDNSAPPHRIAWNTDDAAFWYNPTTGIIQARVPGGVSDAASLELYNYINDCHLTSFNARE